MKRLYIIALLCSLLLCITACKAVTGGNYRLGSGETLSGDLTVSGGNAVLEQGSRVTGSLFVTGGSVDANGEIGGNVSLTGGNVDFGSSAVVHGVVQKIGGNYSLAPGARIRIDDSIGATFPTNSFGMFILFPLLLVALVVIFLTTRTGRTSPSTNAPAPTVNENAPASERFTVPLQRVNGIGGTLVFGIILIGLGVLFLFQQLLNINIWHYSWPLLVILAGLVCFAIMVFNGKDSARLAIPGSIVTTVGLILLYQNTFAQYQSWAYAWALIVPTSIGIGKYIEGWWGGNSAQREKGIQETRTGLIIFVILALFFEMFLNLGGFFYGDLARFAFPAAMILIGVLLVLSRLFNLNLPKSGDKPAPAGR